MGMPPIRWLKTKIIVSQIEQILEEILERDRCFNSTGFPMLPKFIANRLKEKGIFVHETNIKYYFQYLEKYIVECTDIKVGNSKNGRLWVIKRREEH
jgi:hypothetical protein